MEERGGNGILAGDFPVRFFKAKIALLYKAAVCRNLAWIGFGTTGIDKTALGHGYAVDIDNIHIVNDTQQQGDGIFFQEVRGEFYSLAEPCLTPLGEKVSGRELVPLCNLAGVAPNHLEQAAGGVVVRWALNDLPLAVDGSVGHSSVCLVFPCDITHVVRQILVHVAVLAIDFEVPIASEADVLTFVSGTCGDGG